MNAPKNITDGEWKVDPIYDGAKDLYIRATGTRIDYDDVNHVEQEANAKMMASSKKLAEALNNLMGAATAPASFHSEAMEALLEAGYTHEP